jgi:hypothetical protein
MQPSIPHTSIRTNRAALTRIQRAIESHPGASPSAVETAAELVGCWIDRFEDHDRQERTMAVEAAFNVQLDSYTFAVGVIDRISYDPDDGVYVVNEWKTARAESDRPGPWAWGERKWLSEITSGIQLPTYALAAKYGRLALKRGLAPFMIKDAARLSSVRVRVRAAVKKSPPDFWPGENEYAKTEAGLYEYDAGDIEAARIAYLNAARVIRALRAKDTGLPWQHTGGQCFHQYGHDCSFLETCRTHAYFTGPYRVYDPDSDEFDYLEKFGLARLKRDARTVILSASSYKTWATCHEKWRITKGLGRREETNDLALQIGGSTHSGLAEFYRIMKEGK